MTILQMVQIALVVLQGLLEFLVLLFIALAPGVLVHEFGHWAAARWFGCKATFGFNWMGPCVRHDAEELGLPLWKRTVITAAGSGAALSFALCLYLVGVSSLVVLDISIGDMILWTTFWAAGIGQLLYPHRKADGWRIVQNLFLMVKGSQG